MLDRQIPDLTFQRIPTGSHGTPWDLRTYLYAGGAGIERRKVPSAIQSGDLGPPLLDRLPLMVKLHELIVEKLEQGGESAISTVIANLKQLTSFFSWAEANGKNLKLEAIRRTYLDWVESLVYRYQIKKDLLHTAAYNQALTVGRYIALSLDSHHSEPGRGILSHKPSKSHPPHPAHAVIDRIEEKLEAVKEGGGIREQWVKDARDNVRAGHYHPLWRGHIELMESLHEHA